MEQKRCISSFTLAELTAELKAMGQPGFRAKQIFHWVHQKLVTEFSAMTVQPKTLLAKLDCWWENRTAARPPFCGRSPGNWLHRNGPWL